MLLSIETFDFCLDIDRSFALRMLALEITLHMMEYFTLLRLNKNVAFCLIVCKNNGFQ